MGAGGRGFADDAGPVVPVVCHLGDGLSLYSRNPVLADDLLAEASARGYHGVRTWVAVGDWNASREYWGERSFGPDHPDFWNFVEGYRDRLRYHGLRWLLSMGDMLRALPGMADRRAFMRRLASLLTLEDLIGVDAGNEAWQNGEASEARLQDAMDAFRAVLPAPVWSLTSPQGEETAELLRYAGSVADVHTYRDGRWWAKVRHVFNNAFEGVTDRPVIQSEAFGPGARVSVIENQHEVDEGVMLAAAVAAAMTGQLWVYFSGPGVVSDEGERLEDMPGFGSTPTVLGLLPRDVGTGEVIHGGDRYAGRRVFAASPKDDPRELRWEHTFLSGRQFVALGYAPQFRHVGESHAHPERAHETDAVIALGERALLVVGRTTD